MLNMCDMVSFYKLSLSVYKLFKTMSPYPVTVRLLDPPLHEFLPHKKQQIEHTNKWTRLQKT